MRIIFIFFIILVSYSLNAQKIDILGNKYSIDQNTLIKTDSVTNKTYRYSNDFCGEISSYDISNPFEVLIFYKEFNKCVFVDEKLAEIKDLDFNSLNIQASAICQSSENGIWIFDRLAQKVIFLETSSNTITFNKYFPLSDEIKVFYEQNNQLILITDKHVFTIDKFGKILSMSKFEYQNHFFFKNEIILENKLGDKYKTND